VSIAVRERERQPEKGGKSRKFTRMGQVGPGWTRLDQVGPGWARVDQDGLGYLDNSIPGYLDTRIPEYLDTWFLTG